MQAIKLISGFYGRITQLFKYLDTLVEIKVS